MLRRQQASAIITAREKIVEGRCQWLKMALDKLSEEEIVELDEEKEGGNGQQFISRIVCG